MEQNKANFSPPTSRMTNYIVLKFGELCDPHVSYIFLFLFFFFYFNEASLNYVCLVYKNHFRSMDLFSCFVNLIGRAMKQKHFLPKILTDETDLEL